MHVLQINAVNGIRSTGRTVMELDKFLKKKGHRSTVVYSDGISTDDGYQMGSMLDKKIHAFMSRITGLQGYFSRRSTRKLLKYIDKRNPDIVHIRNLHSNYINMPMLFNYLAQKKIVTVITLHDCWFFTGGHSHYIRDEYYDWQFGFRKENRNKEFLANKSWFFDTSNKIFNDQMKWFSSISKLAFIGVSEWVTEEAKKSKVTEGATFKTIYNWIDTEIFYPVESEKIKEKLKVTNKFIILGVASSWNESKGLSKFIELSNYIDNEMRIVLVGRISNNIKLPNNIISISESHDINELIQYYSMADVLLNLSLEETFGKVSVESLSCGTPVITINSTANAETVGPGCGYVLSDWNITEIIKKVKLIQKNGTKKYSDISRDFVIDNFDSKDKLQQHLEFYQALLT